MLIGHHIGPFLVEKELGAGAMGAVYLAKYLKTGQLVAIKVMSANMGSSNPNSQKRFEREANILKQLKHPNIVRLFGIGKHHGMPYYAMEYIQGETLDRIIARRDRMAWDQVIDLGKQLCAALQHAHDAGIVHRDLKPSNLMILPDGTLKLTDFGIAKDLDVTQLTGANCTVGTAAYMSPEQCRGENITSKSDLYSLGVVFYELLTGRKPFMAENAVEMFMMHIQTVPERPSRSLPELPKWMDTLIVQLLEKRPDQRPRDAAMVGEVLEEIQEKVESGASAGVEAASARRGDLPKGEELSDEDKEAARSLLGKKPKKKKKEAVTGPPIWLKAAGIVAGLLAVAALLIYLTLPPSAKSLHDKAEKLIADGKRDAAMADDGPIRRYLALYGGKDDDMTRQMRKWADDHTVREFEQLMERHVKREREKGGGIRIGARDDDEKHALDAALAEYDGDRAEAVRLWGLIDPQHARVGPVARLHLENLEALEGQDAVWKELHGRMREIRGEIVDDDRLNAFSRQAFAGWRQQRLGDLAGASATLKALRDKARESPDLRYWALYGAVRMKAIKGRVGEAGQDTAGRVAAVGKATSDAVEKIGASTSLLDLRMILHDVVSLYEKEEAMNDVVEEARKGLAEIDKALPKGR